MSQSARKLHLVAVHESGHAMAAHYLGARVRAVTVRPGANYRGMCDRKLVVTDEDWDSLDDRAKTRIGREVKVLFAGALAVKRAYPRSQWRATGSDDFPRAAEWIAHVYNDARIQRYWSEILLAETEMLLGFRWHVVEHLAQRLLEQETMKGCEVTQAIYEANQIKIAALRAARRAGNTSGD